MKRMLGCGLAVLALAITGCGKEVGRVPLKGEGTADTTLNVTAGKPLAFWTSLDVSYTGGDFKALYEVDLGGAKTTCNPFDVNVKTSSKIVNIGDNHSLSYQGKMKCEISPATSGAVPLKVQLKFLQKPGTLTVNDMSFVVKE